MSDIKIGVSATPGNAKAVLDGIDRAAQGAVDSVEELGKAGAAAGAGLKQTAKDAAGAVEAVENLGKAGTSAATGLKQTAKEAVDLVEAVSELGKAGDAAASGLGKVEQAINKLDLSAKRLGAVSKTLSKEFGQKVSPDQAKSFLQSFERMRANKSLSGGSKIRQFDTFEEWLSGNRQMFVNQQEAARYKHRVLSMAASGAQLEVKPSAPTPNDEPLRPPNLFEQGVNKAGNAGMAFGKGMLALAGVNSLMGMAGRSLDMATEESTGTDTLKRSMGDLGVDFDNLKDQLREAGKGLGFASVEAVRLAQQFSRVSNAGPGTNMGAEVRQAAGFSRSYGMDTGVGTQFFAQARELHMTSNETESRRLALMIAESIDRGKNSAKSDEVLSAVANFSTQVARLSLAPPNASGFAGMLAGMTKEGIPGLDVGGASSIISRANDSVARGGGMGEAGKNFTFYALGGGKGRMDPVQAMALAEGGLFGSSMSMFGTNSALGQYYGKNNLQLSSRTNLSRIREQLDRQYGNNKSLKLDAAKNYFGLNYNQAAAFLNVKPEQLGNLEPMLAKSGIKIDQLSATGYSQLAQVGSADDAGLHRISTAMLGRADISDGDKADLRKAGSGGTDALRTELVKLTAKYEQEMTEGKKTANDIASINQVLTNSGSYLLSGVNAIKEGVLTMVNKIAPESGYAKRGAAQAAALQLSAGGHRALFDSATSQEIHDDAAQKLISDRQAMGPMSQKTIDRIYQPQGADLRGDETEVNRRIAQWEEIRRQAGMPVKSDEMYLMYGQQEPKAQVPGTVAVPRTAAGASVPSSMRGVRNNNPGNIRSGRDNWLGKIGDDGAFAKFLSPEYGLRAMAMNLRTRARKNGSTVQDVVGAWAPPNENKTADYISFVSSQMGVRPGQKLDLSDRDTIGKMMRSMIQFENGAMPYSANQFDSALNMLPGGRQAAAAQQATPQLTGTVRGTIDVSVRDGAKVSKHSLPITLRPTVAAPAGSSQGTDR
ncbi:hypothetical protein OL229_10780 [Neisseriaceae bacterium JH1-16]|nr:hypothetical protein [Neisseriaceae bacterium JH1-16]